MKDALTKLSDWISVHYPVCSTSLDMDAWPRRILRIRQNPVLNIRLELLDNGNVMDATNGTPLGDRFYKVKRRLIADGYFDAIEP